ncbi:MAG: hydrogenase maturation nickel metallochaperone HypA [Mycobacterium sp.]
MPRAEDLEKTWASPHRWAFSDLSWVHPARKRGTMHEMALTQSVVDAVCEHAAGRRVQSVTVEIGALCAVVPDAMQFCFELATEGTMADGARLDLNVQPGSAHCRSCDETFELHDLILLCPCGSADVEVLAGRDLRILSMEVS